MSSNTQERTYIDSNIWFAYITQDKFGEESDQANKIIDDIIRQKNSVAVISHLAILEVVNVIRNKVVQKTKHRGQLDLNLETELRQTANELIKEFLDKTTKWSIAEKLEIFEVTKPLVEVWKNTFLIQNAILGQIIEVHKCKICKGVFNGYTYKGVDHYDIQHALIAQEAKVNFLATFDKGYNELRDVFRDSFEIKIY